MKTIAVFLSDELTLRRFTNAFADRCKVQSFENVQDLKGLVSEGNLVAAIVDMSSRVTESGDLSIGMIDKLHSAYPFVPVVGYIDFSPKRVPDILAAAQAGAAEMILRDVDDLRIAALRILEAETTVDLTCRVKEVLNELVPVQLHDFFMYCVRYSAKGVTVDSAAIRLRRNRKTIANWLSSANLPSPHKIVGWGRVLTASRLLEDSSRSLEQVARELSFLSGTALRSMIKRYLGVNPEVVRQEGGFEYALPRFVSALKAGGETPEAESAETEG